MRNYFVAAVFAVVFLALFRFDFGLIPEGDYRFRVAAEDGDAFAQAQLGQYYLARAISREDLEWAIYWLERAASQGEGQAILYAWRDARRGHVLPQKHGSRFAFFHSGSQTR